MQKFTATLAMVFTAFLLLAKPAWAGCNPCVCGPGGGYTGDIEEWWQKNCQKKMIRKAQAISPFTQAGPISPGFYPFGEQANSEKCVGWNRSGMCVKWTGGSFYFLPQDTYCSDKNSLAIQFLAPIEDMSWQPVRAYRKTSNGLIACQDAFWYHYYSADSRQFISIDGRCEGEAFLVGGVYDLTSNSIMARGEIYSPKFCNENIAALPGKRSFFP